METPSPRIEQLLTFYKEDPTDPFTVYALATEYRSAGDLNTAWGYYQELLTQHPDYVGTYYHAGKLQQQLGHLDEAEKILRTGLVVARKAGQMHAASELQGALNSVLGLDYEDD